VLRIESPELDKRFDEWIVARRADIPNLVEIRSTEESLLELLIPALEEHVDEMHETSRCREAFPVLTELRLLTNDSPTEIEPKGMCSPVKTADIRRFEQQVRAVFGDAGTCQTIWPGHATDSPAAPRVRAAPGFLDDRAWSDRL
jgi:hypothetical protein